jgi:hypothetical protein
MDELRGQLHEGFISLEFYLNEIKKLVFHGQIFFLIKNKI